MQTGERLALLLSVLETASAPVALASSVTNHVWGGHFDHEGPKYQDVANALNVKKVVDRPLRLAFAYQIMSEALEGLGWWWMLGSHKRRGHFASIYQEDGDGVVTYSYHDDPAFALIMSLCKVVDYERLKQSGALKS